MNWKRSRQKERTNHVLCVNGERCTLSTLRCSNWLVKYFGFIYYPKEINDMKRNFRTSSFYDLGYILITKIHSDSIIDKPWQNQIIVLPNAWLRITPKYVHGNQIQIYIIRNIIVCALCITCVKRKTINFKH